MITRLYPNETGLHHGERPVPLHVTIAVFSLIAICGVIFVWQLRQLRPAATPAPVAAKVTRR